MLGFKSNQNVQPVYDYYVETDLDDQPVDYSKKYTDQDSYEDCRRRKSTLKTNEFPPEVSKQSYNDEVKVYCIEGTPLTISSASSFCDLREIGISSAAEKPDIKETFSPINDNGTPESFEEDMKKIIETPSDQKEESPLSKEKDDLKEGKSVSFRSSNEISKASSPLMFSRSSSVASLNSFEQQSIVDDRSSVSVFSALTSGLISPSDLPDSPGELMSPALTDKASSPKMDVTKIDCDSECGNHWSIGFSEKDDSNPEDNNNDSDDPLAAHAQLTKEFIPMDSYKSDGNSEEDNEVSIEHLEISNDSLDIDEVFDEPEYENSLSLPSEDMGKHLSKSDNESDEDDDILLQQCIQLGMPDNSSEKRCDSNVYKKIDCQPCPQSGQACQVERKKEVLSPIDEQLKSEERINNVLNHKRELKLSKTISDIGGAVEMKLKAMDDVKSDDDSDDEDDELLNRCIRLGMPENTCNKLEANANKFIKTPYLPHPNSYHSEDGLLSPLLKSDEDSDGDDILLQQCIQLGMPNKPSKDENSRPECRKMASHNFPAKTNTSPVHLTNKCNSNKPLHPNRNNVMPLPCMQYRMPYKLSDKSGMHVNPATVVKCSSPVKNHLIEMRMSREAYDKKILDPAVLKKSEYNSHPVNYHSINDQRDNCPDGVSDGDEEDDLLAKCIRAGMPSPRAPNPNVQIRLHSTQTPSTSRKSQLPNRSFLPETHTESHKKLGHPRLPQNQPYAPIHSSATWISSTSFIDVDSMRIYRTEDTPILSPSASISDLSSLSFNESFLNNSRNSDCSSESDDDDDDNELLLRCIRSGMPEAKRAVA